MLAVSGHSSRSNISLSSWLIWVTMRLLFWSPKETFNHFDDHLTYYQESVTKHVISPNISALPSSSSKSQGMGVFCSRLIHWFHIKREHHAWCGAELCPLMSMLVFPEGSAAWQEPTPSKHQTAQNISTQTWSQTQEQHRTSKPFMVYQIIVMGIVFTTMKQPQRMWSTRITMKQNIRHGNLLRGTGFSLQHLTL